MTTVAKEVLTRTTRATIEWASEDLGLSYDQIGSAVGADRRTIHRWRAAESRPSRTHQERVEKLQQLRYLLESAFRDERAVLEWLHSPVPAFRGRSPLSLLREGQLDELIEAVATLDAGSVV
jgi:uncharacterized protein (DUF2384 family)